MHYNYPSYPGPSRQPIFPYGGPPFAPSTIPASPTFDPQITLDAAFAAHNPAFSSYAPPHAPSRPQLGLAHSAPQNASTFHFHLPDDDDADADDDNAEEEPTRPGPARASGACDACKLSKVKCVYSPPAPKCRRCATSGQECHFSGRRQKPPPPSHTELLARNEEKDRVIRRLLRGPTSSSSAHSDGLSDEDALPPLPVYDRSTPKHQLDALHAVWIEEARRRVTRRPSPRNGSDGTQLDGRLSRDLTDTPNPRRWSIPGDAPDPPLKPDIFTRGIVKPHEVDELFKIYYEKIHMFHCVCDPVIHTPQNLFHTSPFLYTTICAVASRHYTRRPELYQQLLDSAKQAAGAALNGRKSVETCQAYLLLGVYHPPVRTFRQDRTFLYLGLAIRMATDLGLHLAVRAAGASAHEERAERALRNRQRVWLNCFCSDRSISTQLGKPSAIMIPTHKAVPFDLREWWCGPYSHPYDIHLCAYASLLKVMSGFHDVVYSNVSEDGGRKKLDLQRVQAYADELAAVGTEWLPLLEQNYEKHAGDGLSRELLWRDNLWPFLVSYAKLVVLSVGLQDGLRQGLKHDNPFSYQCIDAASDVLTRVMEKLAKLGYLRFSVEAYFLFTGFAAAFLLKILWPKFAFMMRDGREEAIIQLVERLIKLFGSETVAIDSRHTPSLYARFLADVLAKHKQARARRAAAAAAAPAGGTFSAADPQWMALFRGVMDVDVDAEAEAGRMPASMTLLADPRFWDQGTTPGMAWDQGTGTTPPGGMAWDLPPGGMAWTTPGDVGTAWQDLYPL